MRVLCAALVLVGLVISVQTDATDNPRALMYAAVALYQVDDYAGTCDALQRSVASVSPYVVRWDANVRVAATMDLDILRQTYRACP